MQKTLLALGFSHAHGAPTDRAAAGRKYGSLWEFYACQATLYGTVAVAGGGTGSVPIFEKAPFLPERRPAAFALKEVQTMEEGGLWLRYFPKRQEEHT